MNHKLYLSLYQKFEKTIMPQSSFSDLSQNTNRLAEKRIRCRVLILLRTLERKPKKHSVTLLQLFELILQKILRKTQLKVESIEIKNSFPPLIDSNSLSTVVYDAHINTRIEYSIYYKPISKIIQDVDTLHQNCDVKKHNCHLYLLGLFKILKSLVTS